MEEDVGKTSIERGNIVCVQVAANTVIHILFPWNMSDLFYVQWQQMGAEMVLTISLSVLEQATCLGQMSCMPHAAPTKGPAVSAPISQ